MSFTPVALSVIGFVAKVAVIPATEDLYESETLWAGVPLIVAVSVAVFPGEILIDVALIANCTDCTNLAITVPDAVTTIVVLAEVALAMVIPAVALQEENLFPVAGVAVIESEQQDPAL
jgi:hypothetical protein